MAALGQLPRAQRLAIVLHHLADLPVERVAEETGSSVSAVKKQLVSWPRCHGVTTCPMTSSLFGRESDDRPADPAPARQRRADPCHAAPSLRDSSGRRARPPGAARCRRDPGGRRGRGRGRRARRGGGWRPALGANPSHHTDPEPHPRGARPGLGPADHRGHFGRPNWPQGTSTTAHPPAWSPRTPTPLLMECIGDPRSLGAAELHSATYHWPGRGLNNEFVLLFHNEASSVSAFADLQSGFVSCLRNSVAGRSSAQTMAGALSRRMARSTTCSKAMAIRRPTTRRWARRPLRRRRRTRGQRRRGHASPTAAGETPPPTPCTPAERGPDRTGRCGADTCGRPGRLGVGAHPR